jgi:uncharacterized membrane-anchored protein YitT (DUF2179 family)
MASVYDTLVERGFLKQFTHEEEIKKYIVEKLNSGVTIFNAEGGYSGKKTQMLLCVVRTQDYFMFKEGILQIDPNLFLVINDCHGVSGGVKRSNLPFI